MPGPEQKKKSHNQQIEEARGDAQPPFQPTDYTGLKLDNALAEQIAQQPVSEYLIFRRAKTRPVFRRSCRKRATTREPARSTISVST